MGIIKYDPNFIKTDQQIVDEYKRLTRQIVAKILTI
jgi:hypothetical protein